MDGGLRPDVPVTGGSSCSLRSAQAIPDLISGNVRPFEARDYPGLLDARDRGPGADEVIVGIAADVGLRPEVSSAGGCSPVVAYPDLISGSVRPFVARDYPGLFDARRPGDGAVGLGL